MTSTVNTDSDKIRLLRLFSSRPLLTYEEDKNLFVPFDKEIQQLIQAVETFENALIIGERGGGKTTLLNHIIYKYADNESTILLKINALNLDNFNSQELLVSIIRELQEKSRKISRQFNTLRDFFESKEFQGGRRKNK